MLQGGAQAPACPPLLPPLSIKMMISILKIEMKVMTIQLMMNKKKKILTNY